MANDINFWQANFWGILGTVSGLTGVIVSWFNFHYNTPKIDIDKMYLIIPSHIPGVLKHKPIAELKKLYLGYELEIVVRNKRGGAGSIDKPNLVIKIPNGKKFGFFLMYKTVVVNPQTQHTEYQKESENVTSFWTVRHGKAFNLGGGEKVDERLKYEVNDPEMMHAIVENFENVHYFAEYWDNNGKHHEKRIRRTINEVVY
jgi:hypothetical protein